MSAFVQSTDHIDLIVTAALRYIKWTVQVKDERISGYRPIEVSHLTADDIGRTLLAENVKSVCYRYGESVDPDEYAEYAAAVEGYRFRSVNLDAYGVPAAALVLKAIGGLEYQSCEHPEWETSDAKAVLDAVQAAAIGAVPGYSEAPSWSFDRPALVKS